MSTLDRQGVEFSIGAKQNTTIRALIADIPETAWVMVKDYSPAGEAQIAETSFKGWRLIVRRTRLTDPEQLALWPDWRYHAFLTNRTVPLITADIDHHHRRHRSSLPRSDRAGDPRSQRPSAAPLPVRAHARQQRLDRDRRPGAQPRTLGHADRNT